METVKVSFCIPILILLLSINLMIFNKEFYEQEVPNYTQHEQVIENLLSYFKGGTLHTEEYSEREILHLRDVRNLIWTSWFLILLCTVAIIYASKKQNLKKELKKGAYYTGIAIILLSLIFLNFSDAFITFHKIIFTNDYWLLPETSLLIQMFPERFFIESTKQILLYSLILTLFTYILAVKIPGGKNDHKRTQHHRV
jgi:integral membrane protein (TIGR01906 family)